MQHHIRLLVLAATVGLAACSETGTDDGAATTPAAPEQPAWLAASLPPGAMDVAVVKKTAKEGDTVIVRGRIGGRVEPMSTDSAVFIMMDPAIPSCADLHGDRCATPWDYCCETPEALVANNATVSLLGPAGTTPLEVDLAGHGFAPLDEIIVVGTVGPRPTDDVFVIEAESLYRVPAAG